MKDFRSGGVYYSTTNTNDFDKFIIKEEGYPVMDQVAGFMLEYPELHVLIEGHTDSRGNYWHNIKLSQIRANLVKNYFVKNCLILVTY